MRKLYIVLLGGAMLASIGCQGAGTAGGAAGEAGASQLEQNIVWPKAPAQPRIRYLRSVSTAADMGIERGFFGKIVDAVVGRPDSRLMRPTGVAEMAGVLYVADPGAQALWIFDSARQRTIAVRKAGKENLVAPVAVAPEKNGRVYLADSMLRKIFLFDADGNLAGQISDKSLKRPAALAYTPSLDRLYVVDSEGQQVVVFSGSGERLSSWGRRGTADGEFNYPSYISFAGANVIVTDALNYRIQAFDRDGKFQWKIGRQGDGGGDFASPKGVASDLEGHLYVVDALFDAIQIFDREGALLLAFGGHGASPGEFALPTGAFIDNRDRMYVADSYNQRVQVFEFIADSGPKDAPQTAQR